MSQTDLAMHYICTHEKAIPIFNENGSFSYIWRCIECDALFKKKIINESKKYVEDNKMIQTPEPDYYIHIGIKDDKVIRVNWEEMMKKYNLGNGTVTEKIIIEDVKKFLKEAACLVG